jgi:hypothetical protein
MISVTVKKTAENSPINKSLVDEQQKAIRDILKKNNIKATI